MENSYDIILKLNSMYLMSFILILIIIRFSVDYITNYLKQSKIKLDINNKTKFKKLTVYGNNQNIIINEDYIIKIMPSDEGRTKLTIEVGAELEHIEVMEKFEEISKTK